jgi:hypothetical protein
LRAPLIAADRRIHAHPTIAWIVRACDRDTRVPRVDGERGFTLWSRGLRDVDGRPGMEGQNGRPRRPLSKHDSGCAQSRQQGHEEDRSTTTTARGRRSSTVRLGQLRTPPAARPHQSDQKQYENDNQDHDGHDASEK